MPSSSAISSSLRAAAPPADPAAGRDPAAESAGERPAPADLADLAELSTDLRLAILRLSRRVRHEAAAADLGEAQYCVLAELTREGAVTPRALADHARVRPPTMTRTIAGLEEQGLVVRRPHPDDGRQILVELTEAGVELVAETKRRRTAWMSRRLAELTEAERELLAEATIIIRRLAST